MTELELIDRVKKKLKIRFDPHSEFMQIRHAVLRFSY